MYNAVRFFILACIFLSAIRSSRLVAADTMMRGCSNSAVLRPTVFSMRRVASSFTSGLSPRVRSTPFSSGYDCFWSNRYGTAFVTGPINVLNSAKLSLSSSTLRNIATSFPIRASVTNDSTYGSDYNPSESFNNSAFSSVITEGLNPSQEEATLRPRYSITRVIAGPGAGKTKVLTCRIAHLLLNSDDYNDENQYSMRPEGILAVTFTKKAAIEMERRLNDLLTTSTEVMFKSEQHINDGAMSTKQLDGVDESVVINGNADPTDDGQSNDFSRQLMRQTTLGTFHSVCSKILRKFGNELANLPSVRECTEETQPLQVLDDEQGVHRMPVQTLDGSFNILDQADQLRVLKDVLQQHNIVLKSNSATSGGGKKDEIRPITILNAISLLNTEDAVLRTPQNNARKDTISKEVKEKMSRKVREIASEIRIPFQKAKYTQNSVDFDDLMFLTRELLLYHPEVRKILHRRWRHILVDEFQDTSQIQMDLVRLLTTNSLFVVGDGDQSIYSWRGASPESMTDFEGAFHNKLHGWEGLIDHNSIDLMQYYQQIDRMPSSGHGSSPLQVKSVYLMENYRSTTNIVKAAQKIISSSEGKRTAAQDDIRRDMKPMRGVGPSPRVLACKNAKAESNFVVKSVNEMLEKGELTPSSTVAMIYRTNAQSRLLEEACVEQNLRYVVRGSTGTFYKRAEIQDSLSFLKIMYNSRDRSAWARAVKAPSRGIGETSLNEFFRYCDAVAEKYSQTGNVPPSPMDVLLSFVQPAESDIRDMIPPSEFLSTRSMNRFTPFASLLLALRTKLKTQTVNEFLLSVIEDLNLNSHFDAISKTRDEYEDRLSNVMELVRAAERYKDDGPCVGSEAEDESESPLERFLDDVALIADIEPSQDDEDPSDKRIVANLMTIHSSKGMEFDAVFLVGNEEGTFPTQKAIGQGEGSIELSEEKRLCYVAMTRAKTHLTMTWRREVGYFAGNTFRTKDADRSRFLDVLVSKSDGKERRNIKQTVGIKSHRTPPVSRRIHTEVTRKDHVSKQMPHRYSNADRSGNRKSTHQQLTASKSSLHKSPAASIIGRTENGSRMETPPEAKKNWDDWEPSQLRRPIKQIPSIRQVSSLPKEKHHQRAMSLTKVVGATSNGTRNQNVRKAPTSSSRQPIRRNDYQEKQSAINKSYSPIDLNSFSSDPPPDIDSTLFYPVGSSVKHKFYGQGTVQPPPDMDEKFAKKMLVRVKFVDQAEDWDLPMDSLMHTYD